MSKQTRAVSAVYSSRILLPQFVWTGACIVQSRWHMRASPALGRRRRTFSPQKFASKNYHLAFVKGLIKKVGTSWYHHGIISHLWHLRSAIAFTILWQHILLLVQVNKHSSWQRSSRCSYPVFILIVWGRAHMRSSSALWWYGPIFEFPWNFPQNTCSWKKWKKFLNST